MRKAAVLLWIVSCVVGLLLVITVATDVTENVSAEQLPQPEAHKQVVYRYIPIDKEFFQWDRLYDQLYNSKQQSQQQVNQQQQHQSHAIEKASEHGSSEQYDYMSRYKQNALPTFQFKRTSEPRPAKHRTHSRHAQHGVDQLLHNDHHHHDTSDEQRETERAPHRQYDTGAPQPGHYQDLHQTNTNFVEKNIQVFQDKIKQLPKPKRKYKKNHFQFNLSLPQFISREDMRGLLFRLTAFTLLSVLIIMYAANAIASDPQTYWSNIFRRNFDLASSLEGRAHEAMSTLSHVLDAEDWSCARVRLCQHAQRSNSRTTKLALSAALYTTMTYNSTSHTGLKQLTSVIFDEPSSHTSQHQASCSLLFPRCTIAS